MTEEVKELKQRAKNFIKQKNEENNGIWFTGKESISDLLVEFAEKENEEARKIIKNLLPVAKFYNKYRDKGAIMDITPIYEAEQFLGDEE